MAKRILAVEDDPDILFVVELVLKDYGYEVATSVDGQDVMSLVETFKPDLILMDIRLPRADGREICKTIKSQHKDSVVVLMSAHMDLSKMFQEACANDFIQKPFDIDNLLERIQLQLPA